LGYLLKLFFVSRYRNDPRDEDILQTERTVHKIDEEQICHVSMNRSYCLKEVCSAAGCEAAKYLI
jgi:AraC-like DNA-binding protein